MPPVQLIPTFPLLTKNGYEWTSMRVENGRLMYMSYDACNEREVWEPVRRYDWDTFIWPQVPDFFKPLVTISGKLERATN